MRTRSVAQPPPSPGPSASQHGTTAVWISLLLLLATIAVYLPVRHYDFVNYDDPQYVRDNPNVHAGLTPQTLLWACSALQNGNWHPLTTLSYVLDYQLFGLNPGPYHLVNLGFHVLNTLLLFWIFTRLTGAVWRSASVAALFALHPLHVESVAWIAERKDLLSTFFWLVTAWCYLAYIRRPNAGRYALLLVAYIAALLSKPMVVTLPFVLLLLDIWPLRRLTFGAGPPRSPALTKVLSEKLPLFLLAGLASVVTYIAQVRAGAVNALQASPLHERLANSIVSYVTYLANMLWPARLAVFYPFDPSLPAWQILGATSVLLVITLAVLSAVRRYPYLLVGWLWYLGMLVPVIGLVQQGAQARADRFTYLPLVGIFIMAAWGFPDLLRRWRYHRVACTAAAVTALAACTVLTVRQLAFWRNSTTLFEHALAVTPNNLLAHSLIGTLEMDDGHRDAALPHLLEAARICDTSRGEATICATAHYNSGFLLAKRGDLNGAKQHYLAALRYNASYAKPYIGLGLVHTAQGNPAAAETAYRAAVALDPNVASAHNNLAIILEKQGHTNEAIVHYTEGLRLEPQDAGSHLNLAAALASVGRLPEAIEQFHAALQLKPELPEAHLGLATAYAQAGQTQAAIAELDDLLRAQPDSTAVEAILAWLLATTPDASLRDGARAVHLAEDAARRSARRNAVVLNSLAAAYAESGRFTDAAATATEALELVRNATDPSWANVLIARRSEYQAGHAVRDRPGNPPQ